MAWGLDSVVRLDALLRTSVLCLIEASSLAARCAAELSHVLYLENLRNGALILFYFRAFLFLITLCKWCNFVSETHPVTIVTVDELAIW